MFKGEREVTKNESPRLDIDCFKEVYTYEKK
jgi:hypothetical protein